MTRGTQPDLWRAVGLAAFSGAMTALCYPKPGLCLLAWVSLAPLFGVWFRCASWKGAFVAGLAAGAGFHGVLLHWIYQTCLFAGMGHLLAVLSLVSLALFLGFNWGLIGILGRWLAPGPLAGPWVWAAVWTSVTAASAWWTPRLSVDILSYTQYKFPALIQIGALAGPHALGFLVLAANVVLRDAWEVERRAAANVAAVLALVAGVWAYGTYELTRREEFLRGTANANQSTLAVPGAEGARDARVELIQPAIDQYRKWDSRFESEIKGVYEDLLSRPRSRPPDLVVWPESALPWMVADGTEPPLVSDWARKLGVPQFVGVVSQGKDGGRRCSILLVGPDGRVLGSYHKRQLVPFGEWVPLRFLGDYIGILNQMGDMTPGPARQELLKTPLGATAASICYEATFPRWVRADVGRGATVVINVTNDGWYKDTWGPYLHFGSNFFRAIENRVTVVRCGNTGISGVIDPWGFVTASLALNERGRLDADVPRADPFPRRSPFARLGDWFGACCAALVLVLSGARLASRRA
ncbi:MAG: apolipoprotein N-acyltransferase [Elusimicrobia bacterium]|nr:apolipoprotein N-acyltransferase [Elusimicrobiota bacterium]